MARRKSTKVSGDYASGIALPVRGDHDGGMVLSEGDEYIFNQVLAVVSPNDSANPFQELGGDEFPIFQNADDPSWRSHTRSRIKRQFAILTRENLARLESIKFGTGDEDGNFNCKIEYVNLESTEKKDIEIPFNNAGEVLSLDSDALQSLFF